VTKKRKQKKSSLKAKKVFFPELKSAKLKLKKENFAISSVLAEGLNKILSRSSRSSAAKVFLPDKAGEKSAISPAQPRSILLPKKKEKEFNLNIAHNRLDQYSSPFVMNLSQLRFIEKSSVARQTEEININDLPAGHLLDRLHLFSFWDWSRSEILGWLNEIWRISISPLDKQESYSGFSIKLPWQRPADRWTKAREILEQLALINLLSGLVNAYYSGFCRFAAWLDNWREFIYRRDKKDEEINISRNFQLSEIEPAPEIKAGMAVKAVAPGQIARFKPAAAGKKFFGLESTAGEIKSRLSGLVKNLQLPAFNLPLRNAVAPLSASFSWKPVLIFIVIALIIIAPIKLISYERQISKIRGAVLGEAESALQSLDVAGKELKNSNLDNAREYLLTANDKFKTAQQQLDEVRSFVTFLAEAVPAQNSYKSGKNLLDLGENLSLAGEQLVKGIEEFSQNPDLSLSSRINNFKIEIRQSLDRLEAASENVSQINSADLPAAKRATYQQFQNNLPLLVSGLQQTRQLLDFTVNLLGNNELKRYLFVFQNDNELRATGGFMGSFALVDIKNGNLEKISLPPGGTYDLRGGLTERLEPPPALRLVSSRWEFQDANWWPDWPSSAANIQWFYNKSGGPSIDGVIAVNSNLLGELLKVVGPVDLPSYHKTITAENFEAELQKSIEIESPRNKPKEILADLAPIMVQRILQAPPSQFLDLAKVLDQGLVQKDILIYLTDPATQKFVLDNNWAGQQKNTDNQTDYLQVVATNIGGGKTDNVIRQKVFHQSEIQADGSIIDTALISRYNFGPVDENFSSQANNSYLRVYVPQGSELVHAAGFDNFTAGAFKKLQDNLKLMDSLQAEKNSKADAASLTKIYDENNKTVFANWSVLGPNQQKEMVLVYRLPFKLAPEAKADSSIIARFLASLAPAYDTFRLLVQKQPGRSQDQIENEISYPANWFPAITYPTSSAAAESGKLKSSNQTLADNFYLAAFRTQ